MLNKILKYYVKEKKLLTYFLVSSFFVTMLDLYGPVLVQQLMDKSIPNKNIKMFFIISIKLSIIYIIRFFLNLFSGSRGQLMGNRIKYMMREDIFKKILSQPELFFIKNRSGDIITRITTDLESVSTLLYRGLEDFLFSIISLIGATILMLNFNLTLTLLTISILPIAIIFTFIQNNRLKYGYGMIRIRYSELTSKVHDCLRTIFFIKNNLLETESFKLFSKTNKRLLDVEKVNIFNVSTLIAGINLYNQATQLIVIFVGGYMHIKGKISFGIILSFILLTNRFRIYLLRLMGLIDVFQKGISGVARFTEIMDISNAKDGDIELKGKIQNIEIKNVSFGFTEKQIIKNMTIKIGCGEKIAFVGESGVGKTTLLSLLKNIYPIENGEILIEGISISNIKRENLLKKIAIVDQKESLMNATILENISIVNRKSSKKDIYKAIELAQLTEFIDGLKNRENTMIEENGINLSSGQKQRIAIARLFLKSPDIIFLDEGTSALDNILEKRIMDNILTVFKNQIVIAIAHRLNSIRNFDRIVVLDKNGINDIGSFNELLDKKGLFYKMYRATKN